jgi:predicted TIM-barrel fold metal-dependent hydrolase
VSRGMAAPDEPLRRHYQAVAARLPAGTRWFDVHTHIGDADPDGTRATAADVLAAMDRAGHQRGAVFPLAEPDRRYEAANDRVLAEAEASDGRLVAFCRVNPADDALAEARRCLDAGARGVKLHPRAEGFTLDHPGVAGVVALAAERHLPVIVHAGRGIPALGRHAVELSRRFPDAPLILAHAGISDLSWIWRADAPSLMFDTSWWSVPDLVTLFTRVPPGRVLFATDTPYGSGIFGGMTFLRAALACGLTAELIAEMAGAQAERLVAGEPPRDLGPATGGRPPALGIASERALVQLYGAVSLLFSGGDPREQLWLARLACEVDPVDEEAALLSQVAELIDEAEREIRADPGVWRRAMYPLLGACALAATPEVLV